MQIPDFKIERYFALHEFKAPYLLCCSDCESMAIRELLDLEPGSAEAFLEMRLGYTESMGDPDLRQTIASLYRDIRADQILVHSGAEEAIFSFMNVTLNPGDEVIVQWPCYQSLFQVAESIGAVVKPWKMDEKNDWSLSWDQFESHLSPKTKAVVINSPHNPTGALVDPEIPALLADTARDRGILIFSDEVYRFLEYDETDRPASFCDRSENAVSLGVMSKSFGLPGLRLGWIATKNEQLYRKMAGFKDYTTICTAGPSEFLANLALRHVETIIRRNKKIVLDNLVLADDFFDRNQDVMRWVKPKAGPIGFPGLTGRTPAEEFSADLLEKTGVLLLPGPVYGSEFTHHFRLGFGRINFGAGLEFLDGFCAQVRGK